MLCLKALKQNSPTVGKKKETITIKYLISSTCAKISKNKYTVGSVFSGYSVFPSFCQPKGLTQLLKPAQCSISFLLGKDQLYFTHTET